MSRAVVLFDALAAFLGELRLAWASGRRVSVTLDGCDMPRAEGTVRSVSPTGVHVRVGALLIPVERIAAVHLPSRLGDSTVRSGAFHGAARRVEHPGQLELFA